MVKYLIALMMFVSTCNATWKPEYSNTPKEWLDWFNGAQLTPQAQARIGYTSCCQHSDRFVTKFRPEGGHWYFEDEGQWKLIPDDTVHETDPNMPAQLRHEGVLFIYNGLVTCFWPPETDG